MHELYLILELKQPSLFSLCRGSLFLKYTKNTWADNETPFDEGKLLVANGAMNTD